jgi:hypothetical protein
MGMALLINGLRPLESCWVNRLGPHDFLTLTAHTVLLLAIVTDASPLRVAAAVVVAVCLAVVSWRRDR